MPQNRIIDIGRAESSPTEPVTLAQVKAQLIISFTDDDTLLTSLITQARKAIENYCAVSMAYQTITLIADLFNEWELPYGPVNGILGVSTRTGTEGSGPGTYATAATGWSEDGGNFKTFIPAGGGGFNPGAPFVGYFQWGPDASWYGQNPGNRYRIIYTAGPYTPDDLKLAVLNEIAYRYENRGNVSDKLITGICEAAQVLAFPYKRNLWF
jgi:Phage gp6-like head-tail connector protein